MRHSFTLTLLALLALGGPTPGTACGDRLVVQGGGVHLDRVARSRHPGTILLLALRNTDARSTSERLRVALAQAGHDVRVVGSTEELDRALRERHTDVVLADLPTAPTLRADAAAMESGVAIVPLVYHPTRRELADARRQSSCIASVVGWGVTPVLQVVDQVRARQVAGQPAGCGSTARAAT